MTGTPAFKPPTNKEPKAPNVKDPATQDAIRTNKRNVLAAAFKGLGRSGTILNGGQGVLGEAPTAKSSLLGG